MLSVPRKTQAFQDFQKFFLEMISISGVGSNDAVTMLLERTMERTERTTERTDDVKGYSSSSTQAGPSPTKNGGVLHMKSINWDEIPETITKDQFYRICHISKQTARFLLQSGKVPCKYSGKRTRCYTIKKKDVIEYLRNRERCPEAYKVIPGWYSGGYNPRSHQDIPSDILDSMREYYSGLLKNEPGVMTARNIHTLTGYAVTSINNWVLKGNLKAFRKGSINMIPKVYLVDFFCSIYFRTIQRKTPWHIYTLKCFPGWNQFKSLENTERKSE